MKNLFRFLYPFAFVTLILFCLYNYREIKKFEVADPAQSYGKTYERVIQSGELRVGYLISPPYLSKQTSSDRLSGIFYDVTEEMGRRLRLKVIWVEEVSLSTLPEGIDNGRFDLIAFPLWRSSERAKNVAFSVPLLYSVLGCYSRLDDSRFDNSLDAINSPNIKVSTIDGELAETIAKQDFPKAKFAPLPPLSDYSQLLLQVVSKKADVSFHNRVDAKRYMIKNPGTIKEVSRAPIRVYAESFILPLRDHQFQTMINATILEMIENGIIKKAFRDNGENPDEYFMPAVPYKMQIEK